MIIATSRLELRPLTAEEAGAIIAGNREGALWAPDFPTSGDLRIAKGLLDGVVAYASEDHPWGPYVITEISTGLSVGGIGLKGAPNVHGEVELGYGICESRQRHGVATEAVRGLMELARTHGARTFTAETDVDNLASQRVLEKCGFECIDDVGDSLWWRRSS